LHRPLQQSVLEEHRDPPRLHDPALQLEMSPSQKSWKTQTDCPPGGGWQQQDRQLLPALPSAGHKICGDVPVPKSTQAESAQHGVPSQDSPTIAHSGGVVPVVPPCVMVSADPAEGFWSSSSSSSSSPPQMSPMQASFGPQSASLRQGNPLASPGSK